MPMFNPMILLAIVVVIFTVVVALLKHIGRK